MCLAGIVLPMVEDSFAGEGDNVPVGISQVESGISVVDIFLVVSDAPLAGMRRTCIQIINQTLKTSVQMQP